MIKNCTGMRKALGKKKRLCSKPKLDLNPPEKKRTKNDELVEHLHGKSLGKNIDGKEWRDFT